jgi:hypothetical protein
MKVQLGHIVQNLFHADSLDEVPVSRLQEIAETHPYFGAGHLLLSQKLKHQQSTGFDEQIQKTALYFHDPLWLHWQLNQHEKETVPAAAPVITDIPEPEQVQEPEEAETALLFPAQEPEQQVEAEPQIQEPEIIYPGHAHGEPIEGTGTIDEPDSVEPPPQPNPEADPEPPSEPVDEPTSPPVDLPGPDTEKSAPIETPVKTETEIANEPQTPNPKPETPLVFEAYHTIDYFASQGIKVPAEVQPGDRLGKQLKSFTEWLKIMRRLPQTPVEDQNTENGDQDIRRIAAGSLVEKEVVTETMAEVLVKQDKRQEAIAIYEKLSLLDPSKRAYFAAKIDNLKEN